MNVRGLHHLAIVVPDIDRAEAFYVGVLGLGVFRRFHTDLGVHRSTWVALGEGAFLALELAGADGPTRDDAAPGAHCIALGIERSSRAEWENRLVQAGHPVVRRTAFTFYVRDPAGVLVGLSHYPDPEMSG
jgi:glyoxylase I family protein